MNGLSAADIARLLRASEAEITAEAAALPEELVSWHPEPGEWCVNECLGHLIEAEKRGLAGRIRYLLRHDDNPALTSWDQVAVARARKDCAAETLALLKEFSDERAASVVLITSLQPDDLARGGEHPQVGHLTIGEIVSEWVHHDRNHFKQMLTNVQSYVWQQMGTAQRFSLPH